MRAGQWQSLKISPLDFSPDPYERESRTAVAPGPFNAGSRACSPGLRILSISLWVLIIFGHPLGRQSGAYVLGTNRGHRVSMFTGRPRSQIMAAEQLCPNEISPTVGRSNSLVHAAGHHDWLVSSPLTADLHSMVAESP